jgi:osmotically-inducible protein OsmY
MFQIFRLSLLLVAIGSLTQLTSCAVVDKRTTGTQIDDEIIEIKVIDGIHSQPDIWEQSHVNATSFNNIVLLTGETPSAAFKTRIANIAARVEKVRKVHNELAIAAPSSMLARSSDTWVTGKVKSTLLSEMQMDGTRVKVVTEKGIVYLMGLVTNAEADRATDLARRVPGVERVVRLFEISQ